MANATARVPQSKTDFNDTAIIRTFADTTATYQVGQMIALNASGLATHCDDTAGIRFDGILMGAVPLVITSGESAAIRRAGNHPIDKPRLLVMKIAATVTDADIGRRVYAKFTDEVSFTSTNSILVGTVERVPSTTSVEIRPVWVSTAGVNPFDGEELTFTGATTANQIVMPDNLAEALSISEGSNRYLSFNTANAGGEFLYASKPLRFLDNVGLKLGTGDDIVLTWDGTDLDVTQATANSSITWGIDGAGIDQVWMGDTASTKMTWDQSADSLVFTGAARILWTGATGEPEMHLTDNLADALSIEIPGSTDLMIFTTTDNAESVSIIGLRTRSSTAVAITGATTLKLSDSGGIFTVGQGSAYDIDLPSPTTGPGCSYFFSLTAAAANNVTITVAGSAATFVGSVITEGQIVVATGSTLTFASGVAVLGDSIEIRSIATNLYHVRAVSSILNGITIA